MTAWERAMGLIAELTSLDTGYDCCLTGESAINVIRTALADAERGGKISTLKEVSENFEKTALAMPMGWNRHVKRFSCAAWSRGLRQPNISKNASNSVIEKGMTESQYGPVMRQLYAY